MSGIGATKCPSRSAKCSRDHREDNHKAASQWLEGEDAELRKRIRLHGFGNWKDILDNSSILQEQQTTAPSGMFQCSLLHEYLRYDNSLKLTLELLCFWHSTLS